MSRIARGAEVTHWNVIPVSRAVDLARSRNPGGNTAARLMRGLARLAIRDMAVGYDYVTDVIRVVRKQVYSGLRLTEGCKLRLREKIHAPCEDNWGIAAIERIEVATRVRHVMEAKRVQCNGKEFGYIRLRSFKVSDGLLATEFTGLLDSMPGDGLIITSATIPAGRAEAASGCCRC